MTKENIMIAALRLFLARGYNAVSLVDVANDIGITKGGIYHYFSSKDEILHVAVDFLINRFEEEYTELLNRPDHIHKVLNALLVEQVLERYWQEVFGLKDECSMDYAHFAIEAMRRIPDLQLRLEQSYGRICEVMAARLQNAVIQGEIRSDLDTYAMSVTILALLNGCKSLGNNFCSPVMRNVMMDNIWKMLRKN